MTQAAAARSGLAMLVGESRVVSDPVACAALAVDGKIAACIVYPPSADKVAAVLKYAAEQNLTVIPCRNGTKLSVGNSPRRYDLALSLKEMNQVWHFEPADLTMSVEPGIKFGNLQDFLARHGLWLPLDPPGGCRASLGGILATNAAGPLRLRYGAPRDMVVGMKIATSEGKVIQTGGRVVKNVAGYDLGKLLIGSFGTLGVIVEANLKLFPLPAQRSTFVLRAGTLGIARDLRRKILHSPLEPMRMVVLDTSAATLLRAEALQKAESEEPELLLEFGGSARVVERCEREVNELGRGAGSRVSRWEAAEAETRWARLADLQGWFAPRYPALTVLKAVLPIAASEEFMSRAQQEAAADKTDSAAVAQVGVGIVHVCLLEQQLSPGTAGLIGRLRQAAEDLGGRLIIERCPPELKQKVDVWGPAGDDFEAMRKLKAAWDPKGILSPGRFVGGL